MKTLTKIVDWLLNDHSYRFFEGSGFALVFVSIVMIFMVACIFSKKLRGYFGF